MGLFSTELRKRTFQPRLLLYYVWVSFQFAFPEGFTPAPSVEVVPTKHSYEYTIAPLPLLQATASSSDNWLQGSPEQIQVYDNVVSPLACQVMHCLAVEQSFQSDGETCVFQRPDASTPLECCIDRILTALGDTSRVVEYWSRDEYMNIDAHVDIDENRFLEDEDSIYCPSTSHVLYLDIEQDLRGPTCIFPGKQKGWGKSANDKVNLVTVPAVNGRLLRFPGVAMHAVPFPPNRWLLSKAEEFQLRQQEDEDECEDEDYIEDNDDDDDEDYVVERSVLLFNTWPDSGPPPKGEHASSFSDGEGGNWEEDYGVRAHKIACNPRDDWREQNIQAPFDTKKNLDDVLSVRVSLMGPRERRIHTEPTAQVVISTDEVGDLRKALYEEKNVAIFTLFEPEDNE